MNLQKWASGFTVLSLILRISTITAGVVSQDQPRAGSSAPQIWFSSGDDLEVKGVVAHSDFMHLFDPTVLAYGHRSRQRNAVARAMVPTHAA